MPHTSQTLYNSIEVGQQDQLDASQRDRFPACGGSGRGIHVSMGCSGWPVLSMDLALRSQAFEGGLGTLVDDGDFQDVDEPPLLHGSLSDVSEKTSGGKTLSEYVAPLACIAKHEQDKPCPVLNLTAKLERVSTCSSVDLFNENFRVTSRDWSMPIQQSEVDLLKPLPPVQFAYCRGHNYHGRLSNIQDSQSDHRQMEPSPTSNQNPTPSVDCITTSIKETTIKPRREINMSCSIEPADDDVLLGRGGFTNSHPGHIRFRDKALELRPWYEASDKEQKFQISKLLLESVTDNGNRFLEKGEDGLWYEVVGDGARKKASRALRERIRVRKFTSA
ncbi:hypothetical protein ACHAXA_004700 [Cyclostephanos tholiformis]|uniref:DUF6824 domain-containing protein n=1 Tax=Cyclostephanos tholiformis TaxID=382380 RepID=A0ABD3SRI7_9STRA